MALAKLVRQLIVDALCEALLHVKKIKSATGTNGIDWEGAEHHHAETPSRGLI